MTPTCGEILYDFLTPTGYNVLATPPGWRKMPAMNLADARTAVIHAMGRMNAAHQKPLFDEWVLIKLTPDQGAILAYEGPRVDSYKSRFQADLGPLRAEMKGQLMEAGDFEFTPHAHETHFDACIRLGPAAYLICNHTGKTMTEIRQDPLWLEAQKHFLNLATKFRDDPLT